MDDIVINLYFPATNSTRRRLTVDSRSGPCDGFAIAFSMNLPVTAGTLKSMNWVCCPRGAHHEWRCGFAMTSPFSFSRTRSRSPDLVS